jgi:hypothetical protein
MNTERDTTGEPDPIEPIGIIIDSDHIVDADGEYLELCYMCKKSRLTCENDMIRAVKVPVEPGDPNEVSIYRRNEDGVLYLQPAGFKKVDGVKEGLISSESEIPIPFICEWFEPKDLG